MSQLRGKMSRAGLIAVFAFVWSACTQGGTDVAGVLPPSIHGLTLSESLTGEDAAAVLGEMHESKVAPTDTYIGYYGPEDMRASLYVSRFGTADDAKAELAAMAAGIGSGTQEYGHHAETTVGETAVHSVFGHGQINYFYASGTDLIWLASPPRLARPALAELLHVEIDSVPDPLRGAAAPAGKVEL